MRTILGRIWQSIKEEYTKGMIQRRNWTTRLGGEYRLMVMEVKVQWELYQKKARQGHIYLRA